MFDYSVVDAVPALLGKEQLNYVNAVIDRLLDDLGPAAAAGAAEQSVHEIPGKSVHETVSIFEPSGRIELYPVPSEVEAELDGALTPYWSRFGSDARSSSWMVFEYGVDQFITPHIDYPTDPSVPQKVKFCAVSVNLLSPAAGGEFYVEHFDRSNFTSESGQVVRDLHWGVESFREARRVRWSVEWQPGDAIIWGTEVSHGTKPVISGRSRKALCFIEAN